MKLKQMISELELLYPLENKEVWDLTGYSVKSNQAKKFRGAILAIDLTQEVIDEAILHDCNLIITHHPFLFDSDKTVEFEKAPYKQKIIKQLKENQITAYSMHTNYDAELYGTSYQIIYTLGLKDYFDTNSPKFSAIVNYETNFRKITALIEEKMKLKAFRTNVLKHDEEQPISKIAFLSGSGYTGQINELTHQNVDLFITSDVKWSEWVNYHQIGAKILEIPHLDEEVFAEHLYKLLTEKFPNERIYIKKLALPYRNVK
ncbi:Nif3-like dinuclear metal center hexameric protein [Mycoplasma corogypsi]|uniref:Nif3-like dinuclear metal center hexameric protein n=1 Tax=Mycoplasma corogypsi TaxID=2106 RepID=UPI003873B63A